MKARLRIFSALLPVTVLILLSQSCAYERFRKFEQDIEIPSKVFEAEYGQAWAAVVNVMRRYDIEVQNIESGMIRTKWMDNTLETNFTDSFGSNDKIKAARFKLIVSVVKGKQGLKEVSKVTIYKRQVVEQDFLQGWKTIQNDGILEKILLYRVNRNLQIDNRLRAIQDAREEEDRATI